MKEKKYQPRFYRRWQATDDLVSFPVQVSESDLLVRALADLSAAARESLLKYRYQLETYIRSHPGFVTALAPVPVEPLAPAIVRDMAAAAQKAGVGPMAAVAGSIAEFVGRDLLRDSGEVIVENGGDVFLASRKERRVGLYAGSGLPPIPLVLAARQMPCGVCTSSGRLGHSLSFGNADSVTVLAPSAGLADAVATACGNIVAAAGDIEKGLDFALSIEGVTGAVITVEGTIGLKGDVTLG